MNPEEPIKRILISVTARDLAVRLRAERKRLGYTAEFVAELLGVSKQAYSKLESVKEPVNLGTLRLLELAAIGYDLRRIIPEGLRLRGRVRPPTPEEAADGAE